MSTLSQFYGGGIKSIQRGTFTVRRNNNTQNVRISSVNVNKTVLNHLGSSGNPDNMLQLIDSTTLRGTNNTFGAITTSYEVIEYN